MAYNRLDGKSSEDGDLWDVAAMFFEGIVSGSFGEDANAAPMELPEPEQPVAAEVPVAEPMQAPAPTTSAPEPEPVGLIEGVGKWFKDLSPEAQQVVSKSFQGGATALMQGLAQRSAQEDALERENRRRDDQQRRGQIPAFGSAFTPRVG